MPTIDDFEDGDISEYAGDTGSFAAQQSVVNRGSWALEFTGSTTAGAITDTDAFDHPSPGDTVVANMRTSVSGAGVAGMLFGVQSEAGFSSLSAYETRMDIAGGEFKLSKHSSGSTSDLDTQGSISYTAGVWYEVEASWGENGDITATLYDDSGTQVAQVSATSETTYTSGGIGWVGNRASSSESSYFDFMRTATDTVSTPVTSLSTSAPEPSVSVSGTATLSIPATTVTPSSPEPSVSGAGAVTVSAPETTISTGTPEPTFERTIAAPATSVSTTAPEPSVSPRTVSIAPGVTPLSATTPSPTVTPGSVSIPAPETAVTSSTPGPAVTAHGVVTASPPVTTLSLGTPTPLVGHRVWTIADGHLGANTDERATYQTITLSQRIGTQKLLNNARTMKSDEGQVDVLTTDSGGFTSVDRADGGNSFDITPPIQRRPLRRDVTYHVERYEEAVVSQAVDEWDLELELIPESSRSDSPSISETRGSGEWSIGTVNGTIATARVDARFLGTGADGVERFELVARLTYEQSHALEAALSNLGGTRVRPISDETNKAVDDTSSGSNTLSITSPTSNVVTTGDYVVIPPFESTRLNERFQEVSLEIARKG